MCPQLTAYPRKSGRHESARVTAPAPAAAGDFPALRKQFRVCSRCPFFCRIEEDITVCSRCEQPLLERCICGEAIDDPMMAICFPCADRLRGRLILRTAGMGLASALVSALGGR